MKLNKLFAGVAVATIALSAMAVTVGAEAASETTVALETSAAVAADTTAAAANPTTGNAPIALVAIPAAIAAAAIVAKKAK